MYTDDYMTYLKKEKRMSEEPWEIVGYGKPETGVTSVVFSLSDPCGDDGIRSD